MKLSSNPLIDQIEDKTNTKMKEIIFDTKCCNWGNNTLFNEYLMYKDNLLLLIETENNMKIGAFIYDIVQNTNISIHKSFLCTFKNNEMDIFNHNSHDNLILFSKESKELIQIENNLIIMKEHHKHECYFNHTKETFIPKRIQVIQFEETDFQKQQRKKKENKQIEKEKENNKLKEITEEVKEKHQDYIKQIENGHN